MTEDEHNRLLDFLPNEDDFEDDIEDDGQGESWADVVQSIPEELLRRAAGENVLKDIASRERFCLIVETGSEDLMRPVENVLQELGHWDATLTPTSRAYRRRDSLSRDNVIRMLMDGGRVYCVVSRVENVPDYLMPAADLRITLPRISPDIVASAIARMTGETVVVPPAVTRLGFDDIALCLRSGATAAECVARLEKAAASIRSITPVPDSVPLVEDLHGYGEARTWAINLIEDLDAWRRGEIPFSEIDRAVILSSAPGLGKTSFVRSLARSARLPLVATSVADWFVKGDGHLGDVIKQINSVFETASGAAPAILFLDEADAVPNRMTLEGRNTDYWIPVIAHLLTCLDSAVSGINDHLIVVAATNHGDRLDPALTRPGRLNRIIHIGLPDAAALAGILRQHLGADLTGEDLADVAGLALGGTGADAVVWVRSARRKARTARRPMRMSDLVDAIVPADDRSPELVERIAFHEAGHAVIAHVLGLAKVTAISIVPQGALGGITSIDRDVDVLSRADIEKMVMQSLAGRAAEQVFCGDPGTGAGGIDQSDLAAATRTLGVMHLGMGLGEDLIFRSGDKNVLSVLAIDRAAAGKVEADLRHLYDRTLGLVRANAHLVRAVASALLKRRRLDGAAFRAIVDSHTTRLPKEPLNG